MQESGIGSVITRTNDDASPEQELFQSLATFEKFLESPLLISSPRLSLLTSPATRSLVHSRGLELVALDYSALIRSISGKGINVSHRTASQVFLLLGVDKDRLDSAQS